MATYKVLQDIEAEDTLIGPLTLRQCIYAAIAVLAGYLSFIVISKHMAFLVIPLLPFMAFGVFFAFPWSKQQPTEVWALAKVRFYFKPRKRIWNQSGVKELVTITVPKNIKKAYASNLSPNEVTSRLKALADTIDSRGWAIKNVDLGYFTHPSLNQQAVGSDRLVDASILPQDVPDYDTTVADMFDVEHNPIAQQFDTMMSRSADQHRQQIIQQMSEQQLQPPAGSQAQGLQTTAPIPASFWHMHTVQPLQPLSPTNTSGAAAQLPYNLSLPAPISNSSTVVPPPVDYSNLRTPGGQPSSLASTLPISPLQPVTDLPDPAILELANNNDLNVATIAREAQARSSEPPDEVVVSLH